MHVISTFLEKIETGTIYQIIVNPEYRSKHTFVTKERLVSGKRNKRIKYSSRCDFIGTSDQFITG